MKITVLSSGSSGNSTLIRTENFNILVDLGVTKKTIVDALSEYSLSLNDINYIFITHEHVDHIKSLCQIAKNAKSKIFISVGTFDAIMGFKTLKDTERELLRKKVYDGDIIFYERIEGSIFYKSLDLGLLKVDVLPLFHDANEPVGFIFNYNGKKFTYITDTGYVHEKLEPLILNSDCYMLEANHDPSALMYSNRPYNLKIRILSDHGHLSNEDSMLILTKVMGEKTKLVLHAHVSKECNNSAIIELTRKNVFESYGMDVSNTRFVILKDSKSEEFSIWK